MPQFSVLSFTAAYDQPSSADVARLSTLSPQTINQVVRKLESRSFFSREPDPVHGRILRLSLTSDGQELLAEARKITRRVEREMVAGLSPEEEVVIRRWLVRLAMEFGES